MNHETKQSDWRTVASCLASQDYIYINSKRTSTSLHSD